MMKKMWTSGILVAICLAFATLAAPAIAFAEDAESAPGEALTAQEIAAPAASAPAPAITEDEETPVAIETAGSQVEGAATLAEGAASGTPAGDAIQENTAEPMQTQDSPAATQAEPETPTAPATVAGNQAKITDGKIEEETVTPQTQDMFRLYNPNSGEHFYTASDEERYYLDLVGWNYEGIGWTAPAYSDAPVYRLYNPNAGDHHYTLSAEERDRLVVVGWNYEGIGWYSATSDQGLPILRQYNPNALAGAHNFTTSDTENRDLVLAGWSYESIAWYALAPVSEVVKHDNSTVIATAPYLTATFTANADEVLETVVSYAKDDITYLLLPSYAPLNKIMLNAFNEKKEQVRIFLAKGSSYNAVDPTSFTDLTALGAQTDAAGSLYINFLTESFSTSFPLVVMKSANIPAIYINSADVNTRGRAYVEASEDHSAKANVSVSMVGADGSVIYNSDDLSNSKKTSSIKGRGNSSWGNSNKKPYQISLSTKASLVDDSGKAKKWILLANSADPTLIGNSIAFDMAFELGLDSIRSVPVDLYYDGEYRGSYLLAEKIQIDKNYINIADLEEAFEDANPGIDLEKQATSMSVNRYGNQFQYVKGIKNPDDISGGYLVELDAAYYRGEACWFEAMWPGTGIITHFVVKSPEYASLNAILYISEAFQEALDNLAAGRTNLTNGTFSFDLDSFAKMYLLGEFFKNLDVFASSTYFYLDAKSKVITSGPVWDFDACMGRRTDAGSSLANTYSGIYSGITGMSVFSNGIQVRVKEIYNSMLGKLSEKTLLGASSAVGPAGKLHSITWYANRISASQRMNELLFGITSFGNQIKPFETWAENIDYLSHWVAWRTSWLNANIIAAGKNDLTNPTRNADNIDFGPVYDYHYYLASNPDISGTPEEVLRHFIIFGMTEGRAGSLNFDVQAYKAKNPRLAQMFGDNLAAYYYHYCTDGFKQGLVCWA